jgi:hypothetical protein
MLCVLTSMVFGVIAPVPAKAGPASTCTTAMVPMTKTSRTAPQRRRTLLIPRFPPVSEHSYLQWSPGGKAIDTKNSLFRRYARIRNADKAPNIRHSPVQKSRHFQRDNKNRLNERQLSSSGDPGPQDPGPLDSAYISVMLL